VCASRPGSLGCRIRFVFPVGHPFPLVVSQYSIRVQLAPGPSQNRACAVNAPGSPPAPAGLAPVAWAPRKSLDVRRCVRRASRSPRVLAWVPSLHRHYPASFDPIGLRASTVLCTLRTPCCHLPPSPAKLVGHTRAPMIGLHGASKNVRASLVALTT
jgi:hypothetical protein